MNTINHDLENMLTANTGHEHGCWEEFAEIKIEKAGLVGKIAGRHDDVIDGRTLWDHYEMDVVIGGKGCTCEE